MARFKDLMDLDSLLKPEQHAIRDSVSSWVDRAVIPIISQAFEEGRFPQELIPELAEQGLLGLSIPEEYGGLGADPVTYGLVNMELERGDSGIRSFVSVQTSLVMWPILNFGSEEQKKTLLPGMAQGKIIGCFGLTEADFGSNPGGMKTTARKTSEGYCINGSKMWITNGNLAHIAIIWAQYEGAVRAFLVPTDRPGFDQQEQKGKLSLRASVTSELFLNEVMVGEDALLPKAKNLACALQCLTQARFGISFGVLGAAKAVYEIAARYATERIQFGKPIASFQLIQERLVKIYNEIVKGYLLALHLGKIKEEGKLKHYQVSLAKRNNVRLALDAAHHARTILGANGIMSEYHIMRHAMNLESVLTYEGTEDIHTLILGKELTGIDAISR